MQHALILILVLFTAFGCLAHPGDDVLLSTRELAARQHAARKRNLLARSCAPQLAAFQAQRKAKRALRKRTLLQNRQDDDGSTSGVPSSSVLTDAATASSAASSTSSALVPHYTGIQNWTCLLAPEVTEGPYYINNELVRQNMTEEQSGIELTLDIGVLDISTCEPVSDAFVEIWSANATGVYSGYSASLGGGGTPPAGSGNPTASTASALSAAAGTLSETSSLISASLSLGLPSASASGNATGPSGGGANMTVEGGTGPEASPLVRNETFGRGGYATDANGIVELVTIYPGFYTGRTPHIHTMVHLDYTNSENGTLVSHSGTLIHVGQFFMNDTWNDDVFAFDPYTQNTNNRTYNDDDSILAEENADGNNAFLDLELLGEDITDGILGYITMGVNVSAAYNISNTNYLNSSAAISTSDSTSTLL